MGSILLSAQQASGYPPVSVEIPLFPPKGNHLDSTLFWFILLYFYGESTSQETYFLSKLEVSIAKGNTLYVTAAGVSPSPEAETWSPLHTHSPPFPPPQPCTLHPASCLLWGPQMGALYRICPCASDDVAEHTVPKVHPCCGRCQTFLRVLFIRSLDG